MGETNVRITVDASEYEKNAEKVIEEINKSRDELLKKAANFFATGANRHTPPNMGQNKIEKKFYMRPIYELKKLIAGEYSNQYASKIDYAQYKAGKKYKIINTHKKGGLAFGYAKTASEAKALAKIANRGLARVMWGKSLEDIGANVPNTIKALMRKSPNLEKLNYSETKWIEDEEGKGVEIINKSLDIEKFGRNAMKYGYENANKAIKLWGRILAEMNKEL